MLGWLRQLFAATGTRYANGTPEVTNTANQSSATEVGCLLSDIKVEPDHDEDFEIAACQKLLNVIASQGARHRHDLFKKNFSVSIEEFFDGNHCKHSIAANVIPDAPFDTAAAWAEYLKTIRAREDVYDVLVQISQIEPYQDKRLGMWPYSDTIWVYSTLPRNRLAELMKPLDPDEVIEVTSKDSDRMMAPAVAAPAGVKTYFVWWD